MEFNGTLIGLNIAKRRMEINMTVRELSEKSGLSASHVSYIERGVGSAPPLDTLDQIANALNTSLDKLLENNLAVYNNIEIKNKTDRDILNAFYSLPSEKKECVMNILRSYDILREFITGETESENTAFDLPEQLKSGYLQEIMIELSDLSENQQRYILDVIRPMILNIDRLTHAEGEQNV